MSKEIIIWERAAAIDPTLRPRARDLPATLERWRRREAPEVRDRLMGYTAFAAVAEAAAEVAA